jgi:hypothetical protein
MKSNSSEKLAMFGKNRYNDWVVLFFSIAGLIILGFICNLWMYVNTKELVSGKTNIESAQSNFEDFKKDVETVSVYINKENG